MGFERRQLNNFAKRLENVDIMIRSNSMTIEDIFIIQINIYQQRVCSMQRNTVEAKAHNRRRCDVND